MCLSPSPGPAVQLATAKFMREGHYLRHLRRMKRLYAARSESLQAALEWRDHRAHASGLAVLLRLPDSTDDAAVCREAQAFGLASVPLSASYSTTDVRQVAAPHNVRRGFKKGHLVAPTAGTLYALSYMHWGQTLCPRLVKKLLG